MSVLRLIRLTYLSPQPINITYGYSRDHRPDLKQFILDLICSGDGDVPIFLRVANGNQSNTAVFAQILLDFRQQIQLDTLIIADSALYSAANITLMKNLKWLCRVPLTVQAAKLLVSQLNSSELVKSKIEGYCFGVKTSNYSGVEQRWLVVESEARKVADLRQLNKRITKSETTAQKKLQKLMIEEFACHQDAVSAAKQLSKLLKYHNLTHIEIVKKPLRNSKKLQQNSPKKIAHYYQVQAKLESDSSVIETETQCA